MLSNGSLDFISDIGVIDHRDYDRSIESKIENLQLQEYSLKNRSFQEVSYFARNMYETEAVTSRLCYIEYLIFLWISRQYTFIFVVLFL